MKFTSAKEQREYFRRHGLIEFEGLIKPDQLETLNTAINVGLASRLSTTVDKLKRFKSEELFMAGRDLWRANDGVKKVVWYSSFADFASELIERKPLRLAFDELFPTRVKPSFGFADTLAYSKILNHKGTLDSISCFDGLACGLMICLSSAPKEDFQEKTDVDLNPNEEKNDDLDEEEIENVELPTPNIFPTVAGNGIFFRTDIPFDFSKFYEHPDCRYFLIAYANDNAYYILNEQDPHTHVLKHMEMGFGAKLAGKYNPILTR